MKKNICVATLSFCVLCLAVASSPKTNRELEAKSKSLYSAEDQVLYNLDSGMLQFYEGDYEDSIRKLSAAENLIYDYYTKSQVRDAVAFLTNDLVLDYQGEDYEDIYLNLIKAIAYYKSGKGDEGFHEVNAYKRKSELLRQRHEEELAQAKLLADRGESVEQNISFYDSALGEYLFMLYYRSIQDKGNVQYACRQIENVFKMSPELYSFSIPSSIDAENSVDAGNTRLNFIVFSGTSAYKRAVMENYSPNISFALPQLVIDSPKVNYITVTAVNKESGRKYKEDLEQIEDFGAVAEDIFKLRARLLYYKALARAMTKNGATASSRIAGDLLADSDNTALSALGTALYAASIAGENEALSTDRADTRHSAFFPGRADVGGISVEPGTYDVTVSYYNVKGGKILYQKQEQNVQVRAGELNLVSSASTQEEMSQKKRFVGGNAARKSTDFGVDSSERVVSASDSVKDDKFLFDLGTEPEAESNRTYGMIQYKWNQTFASSIKAMYSMATKTEDEIEGYTNATMVTKKRDAEVDLFPLIYSFDLKFPMQVNFGASYQYIYEKTFAGMFDTNGLMLDEGDEGKYFTMSDLRSAHILAPRIGFSAKIPLLSQLSVGLDVYANPIYVIFMNQSMKYHSDQTSLPFDYSGTNSVMRWSTPYIDAKMYMDCFSFTRLVVQLSYQRLNFQQMDWADDFASLTGYDDTQSMMKVRFGLELLAGSRLKARARGGIYYQCEWDRSSYTGENDFSGKVILSVGAER